MSHEVDGAALGDDFKGYIFKISGGNDKQGFAMKQGKNGDDVKWNWGVTMLVVQLLIECSLLFVYVC